MYSHRLQVLLTPEQRARLERIAQQRGVSIGMVVREAVDAYTAPRARSKREALDELFSLEAPVADWDQLEAEIVRRAVP